ncbi:MAG TPA: nucleoside triphosphate pyrophosphohydrolase family protein [Candidatus Saccharimonadales bacterium]
MTFDEYQKQALTTLLSHPDPLMDKTIMVLGISGEASEIAEKWKKIVAYRGGVITEEDKREMGKEIGDVLWYLSIFADLLGLSMNEIAETNVAKLASRRERGVQKGSGDNR